MFIDEIIIKVTAGKGGDGCSSFRHEKYIELGGQHAEPLKQYMNYIAANESAKFIMIILHSVSVAY